MRRARVAVKFISDARVSFPINYTRGPWLRNYSETGVVVQFEKKGSFTQRRKDAKKAGQREGDSTL
jgi:hypothetical protein